MYATARTHTLTALFLLSPEKKIDSLTMRVADLTHYEKAAIQKVTYPTVTYETL